MLSVSRLGLRKHDGIIAFRLVACQAGVGTVSLGVAPVVLECSPGSQTSRALLRCQGQVQSAGGVFQALVVWLAESDFPRLISSLGSIKSKNATTA